MVVDETSTSITVGGGGGSEETKSQDVAIDKDAITEDNIVVQKDGKMFVKDASGKIVAELKPMSGGSGGAKAATVTPTPKPPPVTPKLVTSKSTPKTDVDKQLENVRLTTKLSVAGIQLPSNASKEEVREKFVH